MNPTNNPPVTAASVAAAVNACVIAFLSLPDNQEAAICGVVTIACAFLASRFTQRFWWRTPDRNDQADHANPDDFHDGRDVL